MSAPPRAVWRTWLAVCSGVMPILGLMMCSESGRSWTPVTLRIPSTPNFGPWNFFNSSLPMNRSVSMMCFE